MLKCRLLLILLLTILFSNMGPGRAQSAMGWEANDSVTLRKLQDYMWRYPQSQLCDVYKFCFQDLFGLEHMLEDSLGAVRYLEMEIAQSDTNDWLQPRFVYPLTLIGNYVRVDVGYVRDGTIPVATMVSAMLQSARREQLSTEIKFTIWRTHWQHLLLLLENIHPRPLNFNEDRKMLDKLLDSGHYAAHHSKRFNQTYRQHYRIVRRDVFESLLLPLIESANK